MCDLTCRIASHLFRVAKLLPFRNFFAINNKIASQLKIAIRAHSNTSRCDGFESNFACLSYVAPTNIITMHLHAHTNSTPEITLTGMCVVSGTTGENAEKTEKNRRLGYIGIYSLRYTLKRNDITFGFRFLFAVLRNFFF